MPIDLVLPLECGGCAAPGTRWCGACGDALRVPADHPVVVSPRVDPGVPVFSLGRYAGARRRAIVATKERGRRDLLEPLGATLRDGVAHLRAWGVIGPTTVVVPAPTRALAARRRGGDPVTAMAAAAAAPAPVVVALRTGAFARDSAGLSAGRRQRNVAGRIRARTTLSGDVLLVDDVVTTGATAAESVRVLHGRGARVLAVLTLAHA